MIHTISTKDLAGHIEYLDSEIEQVRKEVDLAHADCCRLGDECRRLERLRDHLVAARLLIVGEDPEREVPL